MKNVCQKLAHQKFFINTEKSDLCYKFLIRFLADHILYVLFSRNKDLKIAGYCYHLTNVITLVWSKNDHIKLKYFRQTGTLKFDITTFDTYLKHVLIMI